MINDNLSLLAKLQLKDLIKFKGVGHTKAITLMTALELGRRRRFSQAISRTKIASSKDAFDLMKPILEDLSVEQFWVVYLNN